MSNHRRLATFTREISANGVLDQILDQLPPDEVAATLAAMARDQGYALRMSDLRTFLAGIDVRQH